MIKLLTQEAAETIADLHYSSGERLSTSSARTHEHNLQVAREQGLLSKIETVGLQNLVIVAMQEYPKLFKV